MIKYNEAVLANRTAFLLIRVHAKTPKARNSYEVMLEKIKDQ